MSTPSPSRSNGKGKGKGKGTGKSKSKLQKETTGKGRSDSEARSGKDGNKETWTCHDCGKVGHLQTQCRKKMKSEGRTTAAVMGSLPEKRTAATTATSTAAGSSSKTATVASLVALEPHELAALHAQRAAEARHRLAGNCEKQNYGNPLHIGYLGPQMLGDALLFDEDGPYDLCAVASAPPMTTSAIEIGTADEGCWLLLDTG